MTPEDIEDGVTLAEKVLGWAIYQGPPYNTAKQVREHIRALFGNEIDGRLSDKYGPALAPRQCAHSMLLVQGDVKTCQGCGMVWPRNATVI